MVAGDIINATFSGGTHSFQPAATIEIMITYIAGDSGGGYTSWQSSVAGLTDGVNVADFDVASGLHRMFNYQSLGARQTKNGNLKIGITNTVYLNMIVNGNAGYSGIQIK